MIRGAVVGLRPIEPRDVPLLRTWQNDPEIMSGWAITHPLLSHASFEDDLAGRFRTFDRAGQFIIDVEGSAIGRIDFDGFDERHRDAEISLYVGEISAQRKGYARDAVATLVRYLFQERRAARVELTVMENNQRARRVYESVGFQTEGVLRDYVYVNGTWRNEVLMAIYGAEMIRDVAVG
jgi:diamine N-acetyltransferase